MSTQGQFTGVEQRENLVRIAQEVVRKHNVPRLQLLHANIQEVNFCDYDAFYIFNPFQENITPALRIDYEIDLQPQFYIDYTKYVQQQLLSMPAGTRVVSYCGDAMEIPDCYECVKSAFTEKLKFWVKKPSSPGRSHALLMTDLPNFTIPHPSQYPNHDSHPLRYRRPLPPPRT